MRVTTNDTDTAQTLVLQKTGKQSTLDKQPCGNGYHVVQLKSVLHRSLQKNYSTVEIHFGMLNYRKQGKL